MRMLHEIAGEIGAALYIISMLLLSIVMFVQLITPLTIIHPIMSMLVILALVGAGGLVHWWIGEQGWI